MTDWLLVCGNWIGNLIGNLEWWTRRPGQFLAAVLVFALITSLLAWRGKLK